MAAPYHPSVTPTLMLCLGDFGERIAQALIPEMAVAGPAVQAAVRWLRLTWAEAGGVRLADGAGQLLLDTGKDDPEPWAAIRDQAEKALRGVGLHATHERLVRAGHGVPDDPLTGRRTRCYLIAALKEEPVANGLRPLLAHINALLPARRGPSSIAAFLNVAAHSLDPDTPQRETMAAARQGLPDLVADQLHPGLWPCVLLDWVKTGGVFAEGDDELAAALVALLRVLLLADEPAALFQEALPQLPTAGERAFAFCSLGAAVIQSPPREAVVDWLAARLMAEYLARRCLEPLAGPQEITVGPGWEAARHLKLGMLLAVLAEGLDAEVTAEPGLSIAPAQGGFGQPPVTEAMIMKSGRLLVDRVSRNQSRLKEHLLAETDPPGRLPGALAEEISRGPHGLWSAEALLIAVAEEARSGQAILAQKLTRWPLSQEQRAERVGQARAALNAAQHTMSGPGVFLIKSGLVAALWGYLFGTWAGHIGEAGELAGAVLTAIWVVIVSSLWYVFFKRQQIRRAQRNYITAVAALQSAQVEKAWLEATQAVLDAAETWHDRQAERLHTTRKLLEDMRALLITRPLQLPSNPIIIETLPYLDGYADWLQTVLQNDPLMLEAQSVLEKDEMPRNWPDLDESALLKALLGAGRHTLPNVPELSVEQVLTSQGEEATRFHLKRLYQLAVPLIDLKRLAIPSESGGPSTLDMICWQQDSVTRLRSWFGNHWLGSASVAVTNDPRRVTCIRLVPGFELGDLSDC